MTNQRTSPAYSPAPWHYDQVTLDVADNSGAGVAKLYLIEDDGDDEPQTRANGHLIATAPELLQAVKDAKEYIEAIVDAEMNHDVSFLESDPLAMARLFDRVIAKAEGQMPRFITDATEHAAE